MGDHWGSKNIKGRECVVYEPRCKIESFMRTHLFQREVQKSRFLYFCVKL